MLTIRSLCYYYVYQVIIYNISALNIAISSKLHRSFKLFVLNRFLQGEGESHLQVKVVALQNQIMMSLYLR